MSKDTQYDLLLSKYNLLVSKYQNLQEQYESKEQGWRAEEEHYKHLEKSARELCEDVLAKDKKEMVLGTNYSWSGIPTEALIKKARLSYQEHNKDRTDMMRRLMDLAESRRFQIESLQDQIQQFMTNGNVADISSVQQIIENAEKRKETEQAKDKAPNMVKSAAEAGKVELIIEDEEDIPIEAEMTSLRELLNKNEQARITSHSIPIQPSKKKKRIVKEAQDNEIMAHVVDLKGYEERMTDVMWLVVDIIGTYGISKYPEIEAKALEMSDMRPTKIRSSTQSLAKMGVIDLEKLNLPLSPKCFAYKLSDIGYRMYKMKYMRDPVEAEIDRIIREHDNPEHGYGIIDIERILVESGKYKEVSSFNRDKAISVRDGEKYVPDIICITDRYKEYIEYERGTHTQLDFNKKCNKMCQVTRYLNFVTPNKEDLIKKLIPKVNAWIASRDPRSLRNIRIRLSTALALKNGDVKNDDCWQVVYDLKRGTEPIKTIE